VSFASNRGGDGKGGGNGKGGELKSAVMELMGYFKLRFPSKIAFDIGVQ